jgi:phenylpropionate dioxygenase-like ring-hydroxylating dioxygenase large terminal subunit
MATVLRPALDPASLPLSLEDLASVPLARSETIPSAWYTDPRFHALDAEAVISATWQPIGHVSQVSDAGRHVVGEVAGNPIVVVRDAEGVLRAFYNVCRHRGGPLATKDGCSKVLQCQYHGWTYRLDGSLRGVPKFNYVELFDKRDYGLIPVSVDVWQGLVFVNLDSDPPPLSRALTGVAERIAPLDLTRLRFARRVDYDVACNWKVYVDNYLEGYHIPFVHPELCKLYEFQKYKTETHDRFSVQAAPLSEEENPYSDEGGEALYLFVFPNFMLNILPGRLQTNLVVPMAHDRCRVIFWYYYDDVDSPEAAARIEADIEYSDRIQQEDIEICGHVQRGLGSRAYDRGRFSVEQEGGVYHFQQLLKAAYRRWMMERGAVGEI